VEYNFDKIVATDRYQIRYDSSTGREETEGINGNPDPRVLDFPSLIDIGIMGSCHNSCKYCYQGDNHFNDHMSLNNFKRIIDEGKNYVMQGALGGKGDPNKHPDFLEIMKYSRENTVVPNYTTSGNGLTDTEVAITKQYAGACAVSMHCKDYTWQALNMFTDAGVKTNIHFVVSRESLADAVTLIKGDDPWHGKVDLEKINAVIFLMFKPQGAGKELHDLRLNASILRRLSTMVALAQNIHRTHNFKIGVDACLSNYIIKTQAPLTDRQRHSIDSCEGGRYGCYIGPDMNMMPCSFGDRNKWGVSLLNSSIKDVWNSSDKFNEFREVLKRDACSCPFEVI
jgi:MoaA/NifB/PqqE/SkfB family radical SAM enzyme